MLKAALTHPKMRDLCARLDCSRPHALGMLILLWDFTRDFAPQGNIGKHPDGSIARACDWTGDASKFVDALVSSGWVDRHPDHRLLIHDWHDHAERWVRAKLVKLSLQFLTTERSTVATVERSAGGSNGHSPPHAKPSQDSPSQEEEVILPEWLDKTAWREWEAYRKEARKPLRSTTIRQQLAFLQQQPNHAACIRQSVRNQWTGLFPLKGRDVPEGPPIGDPAKEKANLERLAALTSGIKRIAK